MNYVYVLESLSRQNELYTGSTINVKARLIQHNNGDVFSTKRCKPWKLIYYEAYEFEDQARMREHILKQHGKVWQELKKRLLAAKGFTQHHLST